MKTKLTALILFYFLFSYQSFAQDTLITAKNYRYKFGAKFISERSGNNYEDKDFEVLCGGLQVIRKIKNTKSSFESGIYYNTKVWQYGVRFTNYYYYPYYNYYPIAIYYHYISIPINYRLDTKSIYFSAGIFVDYLLYHTTQKYYETYFDSIENYKTDRKFNIGYNLNLGLEKSITYQLSIFVEARAAITVSGEKTDEGFFMQTGNLGYSNTNYGFGIGINYKLVRKPE